MASSAVLSVARLLLLLVVLYGAGCLLVWLLRDRMVFPVRGDPTGAPADHGLAGRAVTIETPDGERLAAWYLPPPAVSTPAPAVLWFHGNAEWVSGFAPLIRELRPAEAGLLIVDYRGYGSSTGRATVAGVSRDGLAAWDWLAAQPEIDAARLVVYGRSIGSGPALHVAAHRAVAGVIVESAFTSLRALAKRHYPIFPSALAGSGFDNLAHIRRISAPILLIAGQHDRIVPLTMSRVLTAAAAGSAELWIIPGADHNSTYLMGGDEYGRRFRAFVSRVTASSPER
ncbi:MAG: alpha/beta hydrolase [Gemmatimonadota bacterium]|nr:alpha/beta hydrolase [Gemmatimonadota bacterium]MDH4350618.1 alpha/beta hydrolase [Gemmatimonadota bacterium]